MKPQFVIDPNPTVQWPVTVEQLADGELVRHRFMATFRVLAEADYVAIDAEYAPPPAPEGEVAPAPARTLEQTLAINARVLPRLLVGWDGPQAPDGTPVPVSELPRLLVGPYGAPLSRGIRQALFEIRYGIAAQDLPGATEGNSAPPPAAG